MTPVRTPPNPTCEAKLGCKDYSEGSGGIYGVEQLVWIHLKPPSHVYLSDRCVAPTLHTTSEHTEAPWCEELALVVVEVALIFTFSRGTPRMEAAIWLT